MSKPFQLNASKWLFCLSYSQWEKHQCNIKPCPQRWKCAFLKLVIGRMQHENHVTMGLETLNPNLVKMLLFVTRNVMTRPGHNFAHVMTAQLSWHVQNHGRDWTIRFIIKSKWMIIRCKLWCHKPCVKPIHGCCVANGGNRLVPECLRKSVTIALTPHPKCQSPKQF